MCVASLVLQEWHEEFTKILERSSIKQYLRGLYIDDGRKVVDLLLLGTRFVESKAKFEFDEEWLEIDINSPISRRALTEREIRLAMNSINTDLNFTAETEHDFNNSRLPTLSFLFNCGLMKVVLGFLTSKRV